MPYETVPKFLVLALAYYRAPLRYPTLSDGHRDIPALVNDLLSAFSDAMSEARLQESAKHLGCSVSELEHAARFFIRQVLFAKGGDHYRVLGLTRDAPKEQVKEHYRLIIRLFHPDRVGPDDEWSEIYAPRINEAYGVLRDSRKRAQFDARLGQPLAQSENRAKQAPAIAVPRSWLRPERRLRRKKSGWRDVRVLPWAAGGLLALAVFTTIIVGISSNRSVLRANPEQLTGEVPGPSFLNTGTSSTQSSASGGEGAQAQSPGGSDEVPLKVSSDVGEKFPDETIHPAIDEGRSRSVEPESHTEPGTGVASPPREGGILADSEGARGAGPRSNADVTRENLYNVAAIPDITSGWVIQIATFGDKAHADAAVEQLQEAGFEGFLEEVRIVKKQYRVRVGPAPDRQNAEELEAAIEASLKMDGQIHQYP